ncbi:MAG TPA: alpha/beta hydrolase-fold protein [Pyrinomonadaceae bacterium]|nr:alpha/beta hydrolase-fold protein [Pyrinomonadaceae bacterium]
MSTNISAQGSGDSARPPFTTAGELRRHERFRSRFLEAERDVLVFLPPGYGAEPARRYPALYLHDGQNLFDGETAYIRGRQWRFSETAQALINARSVEPLIVVGIYNTGHARLDEYTPTPCARMKAGGKADLYGRLIVEELKPFIDSRYRTLPDASHTGLGGSSLGGLVSLYLGLRHPDTFGRLAVLSPSVWWDNRAIVREVRAMRSRTGARIWLDMGTAESRNATKDARVLRDALVEKGWHLERDLKYHEAHGAGHDEHAWAERVNPLLRFLYPCR